MGKAPVLIEEGRAAADKFTEDHKFRNAFCGLTAIKNFLRRHALEGVPSKPWCRGWKGYDSIILDFHNTVWPGRTSENLMSYTACWCFDAGGQEAYKGDAKGAPYPVLTALGKATLKATEWCEIVAWCICNLEYLQKASRSKRPLIVEHPPAVLTPDEVKTVLGMQDGGVLVVDDSTGFNGIIWNRLDAYVVKDGWLYRVYATYRD